MKPHFVCISILLALACSATAMANEPPRGYHPALNPVKFQATPVGNVVTLVQDHQARATIVLRDGTLKDTSAVERLAARELVDYVKLATGAELSIVEAKDAPAAGMLILVGESTLSEALGMRVDDLPLEGFRVRTFEQGARSGVMIAGRTPGPDEPKAPDGTLFGVYDWLERFVGIRWYYPGPDGRVVPEAAELTMPPAHYTDSPVTLKRTAYVGARRQDGLDLMRHYRVGNSSLVPFTACHTPGSWRVHKDDPETFELKADGTRSGNMPCYGNPKTAELYVQDIARFYETGDTAVWTHPSANVKSAWFPPSSKVIPISPPDKGVECRCDYCRALYDTEGDRHGRASRIVANHVRLVAEAVKERWPDKLVWYLPYANYTVPPADMTLPDNVVVGLCLMQGAANAKEPTIAEVHDRWITGWQRVSGRKVHLWEYLCWPADDTALPFQYPHVLKTFYQSHRDDVEGSFINGGYAPAGLAGGNFASFHPTLYCWMRLMWNPEFDVDAALEEYARLMYGPASQPMAQLLNQLATRWESSRWERPPGDHHVSPRQIHEETMPRSEALKLGKWLAEARALAGDEGLFRRRVDYLGGAVDIFLEESRNYHDQTGAPTLPVLKVGDEPVLDGKLEDLCWRDAPSQPFVKARDSKQPQPEAASTVQAVWTEKGVIFGFHFDEPMPDKMLAKASQHDQAVWADDCIEVFLDPKGTRADYFQIVVNSLGTIFDQHSQEGVEWDAKGLERGLRVGPDFWSMELFIPFAAFTDGTKAPAVGDIWYGNFIRSRHTTGDWQLSRWSTKYRYSNLDFTAFGKLKFME